MAEIKKNPHSAHRQRVRDAFRKAGAENVPDRSLLELILFYSIPRKDVNPIADELLEKYGSLKNIFDASYEELMQTDGVGESSALLLSTLSTVSDRYRNDKKTESALFEKCEAENYVSSLFKDSCCEEFYIISLNALGVAIDCRLLSSGDEMSVEIDKRAILEAAFENDADSVILAHNHPLSAAAPSQADIELTRDVSRLLAETGIRLADHYISGQDGIISLASTAKFKNIFIF